MRILVAHNRYRPDAPSGENRVVDQESAALAAAGHEVTRFERLSGDIQSWSLAKRATLPARVVWSSSAKHDLEAEIARFRPDVVHVHNTFPLLTPSVLHACRDAGVPLVATLHNYKLACASGDFFRDGEVCHDCRDGDRTPALRHGCYRKSRVMTVPVVAAGALHARSWARLVSAYLFISEAQRRLLDPLGLPAERCFVRHNFVPAPLGAAGAKDAVVACVGRLDEAKGAPLMMRAWDEFRRRRPSSGLRLVVAGGGPLAAEVERWAAGHESVEMVGMLSREQVSELLGRARAALAPSQWEETFGLVAVEAMAAGTAPVAPAHGSFPELLRDGVDGALFTPGAPGAVADVLQTVDDDPAAWDRRGAEAHRTYENRFRDQALLEQLVQTYRFAIENPAGQAVPARAVGA